MLWYLKIFDFIYIQNSEWWNFGKRQTKKQMQDFRLLASIGIPTVVLNLHRREYQVHQEYQPSLLHIGFIYYYQQTNEWKVNTITIGRTKSKIIKIKYLLKIPILKTFFYFSKRERRTHLLLWAQWISTELDEWIIGTHTDLDHNHVQILFAGTSDPYASHVRRENDHHCYMLIGQQSIVENHVFESTIPEVIPEIDLKMIIYFRAS